MEFLNPEGDGVRILSLDGGDARCFSQLSILAELMHRLEYDHGRPVRPCEFFHSITGVGASGVIGILLGVLGMAVEEASTAFISICEKVFAPNIQDDRRRSEVFTMELEMILENLNLPPNSLLAGNAIRNAGCLVSICHSAAAIHSCRMFRNYGSAQYSYNPTIIEAARSSWATPGIFSSIHVGPPHFAEELISAVNGFNNPTLQAIQEVRELYGVDRAVSTLLSLGSGKREPASVHSSDSIRRAAQQTDATEEDIEQELGLSGVYYRFSPENTIKNDTFGIESNQFGTIMSYTRAYLESVKTRRAMEIYLKASARTSSINLRFSAGAQKFTTCIEQIPKTARLSLEDRTMLQPLSIQGLDCTSHIDGCMKGTRESILQRINDWTTDFTTPNILWLKGHPGVGKTAIATEIVEQLVAVRRLGSTFFFRRQEGAVLTPLALWRTVAYDLARKHPTVRRIVIAKLEGDEVVPTTANLDNLFRHFVRDPLLGSGEIPTGRLPVVLIDALDECGGLEGQNSEHRKSLLNTLRDWSNLPAKFKLIVTSRGESDIEHAFSTTRHTLIQISTGRTVDAESSEDIRVFLTTKLQQVASRFTSLSQGWPGAENIEELVAKAAGLFIWAQTALKFIQAGQPQRRLDDVLKVGVSGDIDKLYETILKISFQVPKAEALGEYSDFRSVVGTIILARDPLSLLSVSALLSLEIASVTHVCTGLQSVLEYQTILRFHHQTFVDFLINQSKCPPNFYIEPKHENQQITLACLQVMQNELRFNICNIESSYIRNVDIPDLQTMVDRNIPRHLLYSSCWWASHLTETSFDEEIFVQLRYFMMEQFLSWLELLSLTERVDQGSQMLQSLIDWISGHGQDDTQAIAKDMQAFVNTFAPVISQSAAHIYLSALPFTPPTSVMARHYMPQYSQTIQVANGGLRTWPAVQNVLNGHGELVGSVAFSPGGRRVVSGSNDRTIRIWDTTTGETVLGPLRGHSDWVNSVASSADGSRVVSGSSDQTIRIWDAMTGETVVGPLNGHSSAIMSVAFSPDDRRIASGSRDATIRIWDVATGDMVVGPLQGHGNSVNSVAFSPAGRHVVSGSNDMTIRIWNVTTGELVLGPLRGHSSSVNSVVFSPDGSRVVSGSSDKKIRIWDATTVQTAIVTLKGHSGSVRSVAFSSDGSRVVSGACDKTIRIWDATTGEMVVGPLQGHSGWVNFVAFSPDGRRVVSGSSDKTIRMWDAATDETGAGPLNGHSSAVLSVAFSPDGRRVVSGSSDKTIRIWDATTGDTLLGPLQGHGDWVNTVVFSPDGRRVLSSSIDCTIRIWDASTGEMVVGPLRGHSDLVRSVAFSPDGRHVVSGSNDGTIRIWDAMTGEMVLGPLKDLSGYVNSVAFSADGSRVVSGSFGQTIRIWDAMTGETVLGPLNGHSSAVLSVAFSPDGRRVVSGSSDKTIRIWDATTGDTLLGPLQGHGDWINSVAFSLDGRHVVSGSSDKSIRIWNATKGETIVGPLHGHSAGVLSVAFSADGRRIVSGAADGTVRGWDTGLDGLKDPSTSFSNDSFPMQDGWLLGPNSELIFWVPPTLRIGLWRPENTLFIGQFVQTRLNTDSFVHGTSWMFCKTQNYSADPGILDGGSLATLGPSHEPAGGSNPIQYRLKRKVGQNLTSADNISGGITKRARLD